VPDRDARPRRIALGLGGELYFTDFSRGMIGRLDPQSGAVREWSSPGGGNSMPYGIAVSSGGEVYYSETGVHPNTLVRFDPGTQTFSQAAIPSGNSLVRSMVAAPDGRLFLACGGTNAVAIATLDGKGVAEKQR
jgi:virginiamycin B lyase